MRVALASCVILVGGLVMAVPAFANRAYGLTSSFGSFTLVTGVAVDESTGPNSGDVYVVDQGVNTVERFTVAQAASGEPGTPLTGVTLSAPYGVAVDDSNGPQKGDVYVTNPSTGIIDRFNGTTGKFELSFDGSETPHTRSFEPQGVAVDPTDGNVFVADAHNGAVDIFTPAGVYISGSQFGAGVLSSPNSIAVNSSQDVYVTTNGGPAYEFTPEGGYTGVLPISTESTGVSIDPTSDEVYIDTGYTIDKLNSNDESLETFGTGLIESSLGIGQSTLGTVYASSPTSVSIFQTGETPAAPTTGGVVDATANTVILNGTLSNGGGENTTYYFQYNTTTTCAGGASTTPEIASKGVQPTEVSGLSPSTTYTFCLVAANRYGSGVGAPATFVTKTEKPAVQNVAINNVGYTSALVTGEVNMQGSPGAYYYEYGTTAEFTTKTQQRTPETNLAATSITTTANAELTRLQPLTEYHFRLIAVNTNKEITESTTITFSTPATKTTTPPDNRVYEMVTPVENDDADVYVPLAIRSELGEGIRTQRPFQASEDGNSVVYVASPIHGGARGGAGLGNNYMATHSTTGGWTQTGLQPFGFEDARYQAFSNDLSIGVLASGGREYSELPALPGTEAPAEGYSVLYARTASDGNYHPFFTKPPSDISSGGNAYGVPKEEESPAFVGASDDFSRLFFEANESMPGTGAVDGGNNLYESVNGQLSLVNILPDGSTEANATFGSPALNNPEIDSPDFSNVISSDGSRAFWTDLNTKNLYVSEDVGTQDEKTVQIDVSQAGGPGGEGRYWAASSDGSKVFFTDYETARLTSDTRAGSGTNLYEYELNPTVGQPGRLKDLTPAALAGVEGVIGASENGEYVYFVATGALGGENQEGREPIAGQDNLYMLHDSADPVFIGTLASEDGSGIAPYILGIPGFVGDWLPGVGQRTAEVAPNGGSLVFMSEESLTGYTNEVNGEKYQEVYVYDAPDNRLSCASCNPDGIAPVSVYVDEKPVSVGGFLPVSWSNTYLSRWMSDNGGRVFFDSEEALVPEDTNDRQDVYEWERGGEGSCSQPNGCIYLLSGGTSESASWLEGMSADGDDVFIATRAQLAPGDQNENFDLYDARVDGAEPVPPPECTGTGCQGLPSPPPTFATPPSVTFEGVGNFPPSIAAVKTTQKSLTPAQKLAKDLAVCHAKRNKRKRIACEAQAKKRYGSSIKRKKTNSHKTVKGKRKG